MSKANRTSTAIHDLFPGNDLSKAQGRSCAVARGISGTRLQSVVKAIHCEEALASTLNIKCSQMASYYQKEELEQPEAIAVVETVWIFVQAITVFGSIEKATEWISTPVPALGDISPLLLLGSPDGRKSVELVLGKLEHGEFS